MASLCPRKFCHIYAVVVYIVVLPFRPDGKPLSKKALKKQQKEAEKAAKKAQRKETQVRQLYTRFLVHLLHPNHQISPLRITLFFEKNL